MTLFICESFRQPGKPWFALIDGYEFYDEIGPNGDDLHKTGLRYIVKQ